MPDLQIRSVELNSEGLVNDVWIVNRELVFRFAKDDGGRAALASEAKVLRFLEGRVSLPLPRPIHVGEDVLVYALIEGTPLTRDGFRGASVDGGQRMAEQLGRFLGELHGISNPQELPESLAPVSSEAWTQIHEQVKARVFPLLLPHQRDWANRLLEEPLVDARFFAYEPTLIHGDLAPYHILFSQDAARIQGVIDFGVAGRGDPANDLAMLLQTYGEALVDRVLHFYPEGRGLLRRARFYAQAIEIEWALNGVKTGEPLWFLAHLGGARDIWDDDASTASRSR
ncbi:MAG: phosphotransferase [Anaerolineales bacterium]